MNMILIRIKNNEYYSETFAKPSICHPECNEGSHILLICSIIRLPSVKALPLFSVKRRIRMTSDFSFAQASLFNISKNLDLF
jgi:hypothetical protein